MGVTRAERIEEVVGVAEFRDKEISRFSRVGSVSRVSRASRVNRSVEVEGVV